MEVDESNGSQGAHENLDDVGDEPLREAMKNILVGDIKPKDDEDDVLARSSYLSARLIRCSPTDRPLGFGV